MAPKTIKYVKSGDTEATVEGSRAELERILRRYGCRRIEITRDFDEHDDEIAAKIRFSLTEMDADPPMTVPIEFRVDYWRIYEMLYGLTKNDSFDPRRWSQAKRVAWRATSCCGSTAPSRLPRAGLSPCTSASSPTSRSWTAINR